MSTKEKLLKRLLSRPKDFTFHETNALLAAFGYVMSNAGKTSGSRVRFFLGKRIYNMHKPHPKDILKPYQVDDVIQELKEAKLI